MAGNEKKRTKIKREEKRMMIEQNILSSISAQVEKIQSLPDGLLCDYIAYTKKHQDAFYVINKKQGLKDEESKQIYDQFTQAVKNKRLEAYPVVTFRYIEEDLQFGILIWWDDKQAHLNTNINWISWNAENEEWFNVQIHARRMQIDFLPINYMRVMKVIQVNDDDILDGQFVYLRAFSSSYKMKTPPSLTEEERFYRLLTGTPEEEYPQDELDIYILKQIQSKYQKATCRSKLLLFHTDLIGIREYKDYETRLKTLHFKSPKGQQLSLEIDCYYRQSIFTKRNNIIQDFESQTDIPLDEYNKIEQEINQYERLSAMNI